MTRTQNPDEILDTAVTALARGPECHPLLDELPVPIYTIDPEGAVTYWNRACSEFAGREPELGHDRWCVTWRLYTTVGEPMAHDKCPMAQAMTQKRAIRDVIVIAERPDGSRRAFRPYPTPLFNNDGSLRGAVNMLIDVSDQQCAALHDQADRCRRLADATYDRRTSDLLGSMADGFDRTADKLARRGAA